MGGEITLHSALTNSAERFLDAFNGTKGKFETVLVEELEFLTQLRDGFSKSNVVSLGENTVTIPPTFKPEEARYLATRFRAAMTTLSLGARPNLALAEDFVRTQPSYLLLQRCLGKVDVPAELVKLIGPPSSGLTRLLNLCLYFGWVGTTVGVLMVLGGLFALKSVSSNEETS